MRAIAHVKEDVDWRSVRVADARTECEMVSLPEAA